MTTSEIRDIIAQANQNGIKPTCEDLARIIAQRTGKSIGMNDIQDKLDDMKSAGMIVENAGKYSVNLACSL